MKPAWTWDMVPGLTPEVRAHVETRVKLCARCRESKPIAAFPMTTQADGRPRVHPWCRECRREHSRTYAKARYHALKAKVPVAPPPAPDAVTDRWRIWSAAREEWLRQDAMGWTAWSDSAGTWTEAGARERAGNLPADDLAVAVSVEG